MRIITRNAHGARGGGRRPGNEATTCHTPSLNPGENPAIVPQSVTSQRCFRMLAAFSRIALILESSPKIFGLLTAVAAWPGSVVLSARLLPVASYCIVYIVHGVDSWEHTCFSVL